MPAEVVADSGPVLDKPRSSFCLGITFATRQRCDHDALAGCLTIMNEHQAAPTLPTIVRVFNDLNGAGARHVRGVSFRKYDESRDAAISDIVFTGSPYCSRAVACRGLAALPWTEWHRSRGNLGAAG